MLIDTEKLKATIYKHCEQLNCRLIDRDELFEIIDSKDLVPVARCKNCENWDSNFKSILSPDKHYCFGMDKLMKPDDFCSYGKRREE